MNTFLYFFQGAAPYKFTTIPTAFKYILRKTPTSSMITQRKGQLLTLAGVNDPYFEFLGYIRDNQFIVK